jgi:hypothetical protein
MTTTTDWKKRMRTWGRCSNAASLTGTSTPISSASSSWSGKARTWPSIFPQPARKSCAGHHPACSSRPRPSTTRFTRSSCPIGEASCVNPVTPFRRAPMTSSSAVIVWRSKRMNAPTATRRRTSLCLRTRTSYSYQHSPSYSVPLTPPISQIHPSFAPTHLNVPLRRVCTPVR